MEKKAPSKMKEGDKTESIPEAALIDIRHMNEKTDKMSSEEVNEFLNEYSIYPTGDLNARRRKLKNIYKALTLSTINYSVSQNLLPYYIVIDFEATCDEPVPSNYRPEIIEFAAVLVSSKAQKIIDSFQMYCKPQINPILSQYCQKLTGITQNCVNSSETFDIVLKHFHSWIREHNLKKYGIVTDGPWDIARYLFNQCYHSNVPFPNWGKKWINIKAVFRLFYKDCFSEKNPRLSLTSMLDYLDMEFVGRQHSGLDDARNIARVLLTLIYDGANIQFNEKMKYSNKSRSDSNHKGENGDGFKHEFNLTKDRNIVRAQFISMNGQNQPLLKYFTCRKQKQIRQAVLARKMCSFPNPLPVD